MLYEFVTKLQKDLELKEPLGSEGQDSYLLLLDETTAISIIDATPGFQLSAKLGKLPNEKVDSFLSHMLRGNLFGQATHKAVLGLDENGSTVSLRFYHPLKATYQEFFNAIEDFINTVLFWQEEIRSHPSPTSA